MITLREAVQQALEFTEFLWREAVLNDYAEEKREETELALRAALAQQAEPVACNVFNVTKTGALLEWEPTTFAFALPDGKHPLYTAQPQRKWQGLTEKEIIDVRENLPNEDLCSWSFLRGVVFAEQALKEKNA